MLNIYKKPTKKRGKMTKKQERQEAIEYIKKHIKKGDTLYTKIVKVSPSGM
jgi:hypothetical protein